MDVVRRRGTEPKLEQRTDTFTGSAWGDPLLRTEDGVGMSTVYFAPGARTFWHRHEGGQVLYVNSGEGLVVTRDGSAARVRSGDVVWAPGGEEHWHGAGSDSFFVHTGTSFGEPTWLEEVDYDDYLRSQRID
jgi:quercetin dioxygenase-like cupin family protein